MTQAESRLRRVALKVPIVGQPHPDDFELIEETIPSLADGQVLLKAHYISVDPGTRSRLSAGASYARPLQSGETVDGFCVGEVIESRHPKFSVGSQWAYGGGWASHCVTNGRGFFQPVPERSLPASLWIGVLGVPGMTAYFGLQRVAGLREGERVLVSSAAGPVGATAGQLARAWGASKVVGIAGGAAKCAWVSGAARFDSCIDYKAHAELTEVLSAASPEGYDVFFDNVGNAMIDAVLPLMRPGGRIVISGQVGDYNTSDPPGLKGTRHFIAARLRMEGIVVFDDLKQFPAAQAELCEKIEAASVVYKEERFSGLEALAPAFCGLFTGDSFGRRIVEV